MSKHLWFMTLTTVPVVVATMFVYNSIIFLNTQVHVEAAGSCHEACFRFSEKAYLDVLIVSAADVIGNLLGVAMIEWTGRKWCVDERVLSPSFLLSIMFAKLLFHV